MGMTVRFVWIAAGLAWAAPSLAQQSEDALVGECYTLRTQGRYLDAFARCDEATRVARSGRTLGQLGITEIALERWVDAAVHLAAALADREHPWVLRNRATLDEAMSRVQPHVAELVVEASEPGATLLLEGRPAATLPLTAPVYLAPGRVTIAVRSSSGETVRRELTLTAGQRAREAITFAHASPSASSRNGAAHTDANVGASGHPEHGSSPRSILAWTAAGGAVAGFGLALVAWRLREGTVSDFAGSCADREVDDAGQVASCASARMTAESDVSRWETLSTVGLIAGGALTVTSAILFATMPSRGRARSAFGCSDGPGTLGLRCGITF